MESMLGRRTIFSYVLLLGLVASGCRSPGLVGQLCVGEGCPTADACRDGSCERQPECTLERCDAGLCGEAECATLRCAAGIAGPSCPELCPGGVCTPVCTNESCPVGCDGGSCAPAPCTGASCPPTDAGQAPDSSTSCDAGMCGPMVTMDCDSDAGGCNAPRCDTGPCIAAACDDCDPDPGCNEAFPVCPSCRDDDDCARGEARRCDAARGRCVECLDSTHCGGNEAICVAGDCEECRDDDDCIGRGLGRCRDGDCGF
ncbi:MAG TPA: hypothetical protein VFN67_17015 [Polyangiales bacterium]|nr:hypothetical protein [Polyangiales bacterium]